MTFCCVCKAEVCKKEEGKREQHHQDNQLLQLWRQALGADKEIKRKKLAVQKQHLLTFLLLSVKLKFVGRKKVNMSSIMKTSSCCSQHLMELTRSPKGRR